MFLSHAGKYPRNASICSLSLIPLYRNPTDHHIIKNISAGNKKRTAKTAVNLLEICDLVDIILVHLVI